MDFSLTEDQDALAGLARRILTDACTPTHLAEVEAGDDWFDRSTWAALAEADLLGLTLPTSAGGGGYGFLEACLLLREVGRAVAPLPLWSTLTAASTVAAFGTDAQRDRWLPAVVAGESVLAVALTELAAPDLLPLPVASEVGGGGWSLSGTCTTVSAAHVADAVLVPAALAGSGDPLLLVVPLDAPGVSIERQDTFNHEPQCQVSFGGVVLHMDASIDLGADPAATLTCVLDGARVGLCALAAGVADAGMRLTAAYVSERKQFDRAIGTFQAVGQRMADCYVDATAMELTMLAAATAIDVAEPGHPIDPNLVAVAKYWASHGGSRVGHAGLHLHGGISIDLDYPIHRYFLTAKHLEFMLGAGTEQLARIGRELAGPPTSG